MYMIYNSYGYLSLISVRRTAGESGVAGWGGAGEWVVWYAHEDLLSRETDTDRETERQRERERQRETETVTQTQRERQCVCVCVLSLIHI